MIVPSIDILGGRAVQLRRGRELLLDGGDPLRRLDEFAVVGEVAVIDLDAALGRGSNRALIAEMVRRRPCRIGGGIRDVESARAWLDAGAARVILGTAATPEVCSALPRERVMAAVDLLGREVVVEGWRRTTGEDGLEAVRRLAPHVGGFLVTQVEHEGGLAGFDRGLFVAAAEAAGGVPLTAAGGVRSVAEVVDLDRRGIDAQVGMALYAGRFSAGEALGGCLRGGIDGRLWPTVVCEESGAALGLVWSTRRSVRRAVEERRGVYWSRSRGRLWTKGETSGASQELRRVDLDCDRDALRFTVRQAGSGFCHAGTRGCWPQSFDLPALERTIAARAAGGDAASRTARLLRDPALLAAKLSEEAAELAAAQGAEEAVWECADVVYFALAALHSRGGAWRDVVAELARRAGARRRPLAAAGSRR